MALSDRSSCCSTVRSPANHGLLQRVYAKEGRALGALGEHKCLTLKQLAPVQTVLACFDIRMCYEMSSHHPC